jgi:hypothetical protein
MRKPRVVIFNYSGRVQHELSTFFSNNGYEVYVVTESVTCPIYGEKENTTCPGPVLCCDVMAAVQDMDQSKSVDLFNRHFQLGCKLTYHNKTIITHSLGCEGFDHITARGLTIFGTPLDFGAFEAWIKDCESRMDLTKRLAVIRRANRDASGKHVQLRLPSEDVDFDAQVVNVSSCGICLKTSNLLKREQVLHFVDERRAGDNEEGIVQWAKKLEDGRYLAGVTFCV